MPKRLNNLKELKPLRKQLRNDSTVSESKLWTLLKNSQLNGRKFRRQHSIDRYILDFYCPCEKLAVELDGSAHRQQEEYDQQRDLFLASYGIKVLRFKNSSVLHRPFELLEEIKRNFGWNSTTP
jgi:very-short-patch-repair endonuclease